MNRAEFEHLRDVKGKRIDADIRFDQEPGVIGTQSFNNIRIFNEPGYTVIINGHINPRIGSIVYNVRVDGTGPICRVCVRNRVHGVAGRTHKHSLLTEECPSCNLGKDVVARPDLETMSAREVFEDFCNRANIEHRGAFHDP